MCVQVCVAFNPQSTIVATGSMDTTAKLWDVQKGAEVSTLSVSISILHKVIPVCTNVCFAIVIINGMITVGTLTLHCCTKWCSHCEWSLANLALLPVCVCNIVSPTGSFCWDYILFIQHNWWSTTDWLIWSHCECVGHKNRQVREKKNLIWIEFKSLRIR